MQIGFKGVSFRFYNKFHTQEDPQKIEESYKKRGINCKIFTTSEKDRITVFDDESKGGKNDLTNLIEANKKDNEKPDETLQRMEKEIQKGTFEGNKIASELILESSTGRKLFPIL